MSSRVAARYAKSLLELSAEQKNSEVVYADMNDVASTIRSSSDLTVLLKNPVVSDQDKKRVLSEVFKSASESTKNFLNLVVDRKRESDLVDMAENFIQRYNNEHGVAKATVRSAIPLSNKALDRVSAYLRSALGKENIELENVIDASVIGGMVVRYEDRLLDLSVSRELKEIRKQLIYN